MKFIRKRPKGWLVIYQQPHGWRWCSQLPGQLQQQGDDLVGMPSPKEVDTLLLLPGECVVLANVTQENSHAQSLCWQLEPLLSEEIENLHVVSIERRGNQHLMAAMDRQALRQTLQTLTELGYMPRRVLPDTLAIAPGKRLNLGDRWLLRQEAGCGLILPHEALPYFPALLALPPLPGEPMLLLAEGARTNRYSMLQGEFINRPALRLPLLALGAAILLCWFSVLFPPMWQGWQAQRAIADLNQQLLVRYQHYFPQETPSLVRRAFSRKAAQPEMMNSDASLLGMLRHSSALLGKLRENPLQTLVWDGATQQLRLTFRDAIPAGLASDAPEHVQVTVKETQLWLSGKS